MASYQFVPDVTFENTQLVTGARRDRLKVPGGVTPYEPISLNFGEMARKKPSKLLAPAGLTVAAIGVEAPGVSKAPAASGGTAPAKAAGGGGPQAKATGSGAPPAKATTPEWIFTGGDIKLNILLSIYIIDTFAPVQKLFKVIMDHEYLHVRDYMNLAAKIGKTLESDADVKQWLDGGRWTGSKFFDRIQSIWAIEAKRLGDVLDSGPTYEKHKREIASLMPR